MQNFKEVIMTITELMAIRNAIPADSKAGKIQTKYKIAKLLKETEADEIFYRSEFSKIIKEYAVKNEDGSISTDENGNIPLNPETKDEFCQKMKELEDTKVKTPTVSFTIDELDVFELSAADLIVLDSVITE